MFLNVKYMMVSFVMLCLVPSVAFSEVTIVDFHETYDDKVPISGLISVGAMVDVDNSFFDPQFITIKMPETQSAKLCISITSNDGRYRAQYEYDVKNQKSGALTLPTNTKKSSELKNYKDKQVVILATLNKTCKDSPDKVLFASWKKTIAGNSNKYYVYLNWANNVSIVISNNPNVDVAVCKKITDKSIAYNNECLLDNKYMGEINFAVNRFTAANAKLQLIPLPLVLQ
ncbi:MAG: hypothetical protein HQK88_14755 [Nitrospirae bacterium]|nr:hypothetical protein [Nitrospirota bacterium]MBF0535965.1 hypothetical protein [Nitrospirota bacterium]MBF0618059.1 hypothetical protein [Nitrospirota bacterium]